MEYENVITPGVKLAFKNTYNVTGNGQQGIIGVSGEQIVFIGQTGCKYVLPLNYGTRAFITKLNFFRNKLEFTFDDDKTEIWFTGQTKDFIKLMEDSRLYNTKSNPMFMKQDNPGKYDGRFIKAKPIKYYKERTYFDTRSPEEKLDKVDQKGK